jgi:hypothetical protein
MFMICLHTIYYLPSYNRLLVIAVSPKANQFFRKVAVLLDIPQKNRLIRKMHIFLLLLYRVSGPHNIRFQVLLPPLKLSQQ